MFVPKGTKEDETVFDFSLRRFGKRTTKLLFDPLITGIYAGKIEDLSIRSCFPTLVDWEQQYGSVTRGFFSSKNAQGSSFSFKKGMEALPHAIAKQLNSEIQLSCQAVGLLPSPTGMIVLNTNGVAMKTEYVVSALPSGAIADLIAPLHTSLGALLTSIESTSVAIVQLGYRSSVLKHQGFGYLIPSEEKEEILGGIWDSSLFPQQNRGDMTRLAIMIGGARDPQACWKRDEDLIAIALDAVRRHLDIDEKPCIAEVSRAHKAIPQYHVGHATKLKHISEITRKHFSQLYLIGPAFSGVSISDCIARAEEIAHTIADQELLH